MLDLLGVLRDVGAARALSLPDPEFLPARPGEVARSRLDVTRAREELGWEPEVSLRDGLERILAELL